MLAKHDGKLGKRCMMRLAQASVCALKPGAHLRAPGFALILFPAHKAARKHGKVFFAAYPEEDLSFVAHCGADEHDGAAFREPREAGRDELDGFPHVFLLIRAKA